ncbi:MAG: HEAT repeat domain-containing protein [Acidobacteriaceae bacterium]|nr:HEAT repeat domain-containing protein [Acidobacteriaceae bacterium]
MAELVPSFKHLATDEQDSIRVICVESLVPIVRNLVKEDVQRLSLPILLSLFEDKSWKVRLTIAKNFSELANAFGKDITDANLVARFAVLLKDVEADVRTAAVINLKTCVKSISAEKIQAILLPSMVALTQDTTFSVRGTMRLAQPDSGTC